jgi:uracil DNA glycosylase
MIFKNSVRTTKKTERNSMTTINWLILFKEIITVYTENNMKPINMLSGQNAELLIFEAGEHTQ